MAKKRVVIRCFGLATMTVGFVLIGAELSRAGMLSESISRGQTNFVSSYRTPFSHRVLDAEGGHAQVGDVNGDGRNDIVVHHQEYLAWFSYPDCEKQMIQQGSFSGDRYALSDLDRDGDLDLVTGQGRDETQYQICWYENPRAGRRSGVPWKEHVVGTQGQYIKDLMTADIDQDGQTDVVARSHGYTHIFFQQSDGWQPRRMNHPFKEGMALADLDRDGDTDIVLNGFWLETPANPRNGEYRQHTIAEKWFTQKSGSWQDNCASVAVGDVNGDGLLDVLLSHSEKIGWPVVWYSVVSPAQAKTGPWREHVIAEVFDWCETLQLGDVDRDGHLDVMAAKFERDHKNAKYMNEPPFPIVVFYNLKGDGSQWISQQVADTGVYAGVLADVGSDGDFDIVGPRSYWTGPLELWENKLTNRGKSSWLNHGSVPPVRLMAHATDESAGDLPCFKIITPHAIYYLEKSGGGLSSMIDPDDMDWIGFHPEKSSGAAGEYRGFPNAVHQQAGSYFHPRNSGTDPCTSRVIEAEPQHVAISVVSSNELWAGRYDFYPTHCKFTMTRMPADKHYWVLYEGVPGGEYDDTDWWMTSAVKQRTPLTKPHDEDIPGPEWIAFGDAHGSERVLFLYHHEDDTGPDRFYQMQKKMTVFGFGRKGLTKYLDHVPQSFSIGFLETTDHADIDRSVKALLHRVRLPLDQWQYVRVDDTRDKRGFGLAFGDINGDGYQDIVAGKRFYRNPGGDMTGLWQRVDIDDPIDVLAVVDIDGDEFGDVIGLRPNEQYWYEAEDKLGTRWRKIRIGSLAIDDHRLSTQIYGVGQLVPGGKPEIILSNYFLEIPAQRPEGHWPATKYSSEGSGYAIGDIDRDGLLDIGGSYRVEGEDLVPGTRNVKWKCSRMCWWKNPGNDRGDWKRFDIGTATHADRYALADLNGDGRLDLITTEERYPGHVPNGSCYWFEQPLDPTIPWVRHLVVTQLSMNNLDVGDVDRDGDIDLVTCEHTMPYQGKPAPAGIKLEIWENDGRGHFTSRIVDREKESHLGGRLVDLDQDGDLDIVSIAWRDFQYLHVWRNDAQ